MTEHSGDVRFGIEQGDRSFRLAITAPNATMRQARNLTNGEERELDFNLRRIFSPKKLASDGTAVWLLNDASMGSIADKSRIAKIAKANRFIQHLTALNNGSEGENPHTLRAYGPADGEVIVETFQALPRMDDRDRVTAIVGAFAAVAASNLRMSGNSVLQDDYMARFTEGASFDDDGFSMDLGGGAGIRTIEVDEEAGTAVMRGRNIHTGAQALTALVATVAFTHADELAGRAFLMRAA